MKIRDINRTYQAEMISAYNNGSFEDFCISLTLKFMQCEDNKWDSEKWIAYFSQEVVILAGKEKSNTAFGFAGTARDHARGFDGIE